MLMCNFNPANAKSQSRYGIIVCRLLYIVFYVMQFSTNDGAWIKSKNVTFGVILSIDI